MSSLRAALRRVLLESPATIEDLPEAEARHLDRLLESSGLEPAVYARARSLGELPRLAGERESAWRIAFLLATARSSAYSEALEEIRDLAQRTRVPIRLLPPAQLAFFVHESPELRPLASLDVQVPRIQADDFRRALKGKRYFEADDLLELDYRCHASLRPLERDGVVVRIHTRSTALLEEAPWDALGGQVDEGLQVLDPASAALCLVCEIWSRGLAHSLALLRDLRTVMQSLRPEPLALRELATAADVALEADIVFCILEELLGPCVDHRWRGDAAGWASPPGAARRLARLGRALALQHRPSVRWLERCRELQDEVASAQARLPAAAAR